MISMTFFSNQSRIYCPIQKCLRKMNKSEKYDYATQLSDYVFSLGERTFNPPNQVHN